MGFESSLTGSRNVWFSPRGCIHAAFVPTNQLTIDAQDPKAGTAEFKATAIRLERVPVPAS